eukprot:747086-Hanusia_phi.AAC.1
MAAGAARGLERFSKDCVVYPIHSANEAARIFALTMSMTFPPKDIDRFQKCSIFNENAKSLAGRYRQQITASHEYSEETGQALGQKDSTGGTARVGSGCVYSRMDS